MDESAGLGEQTINKIAAVAIRRQLQQATDVEVQIKTDLAKLAQGHWRSDSNFSPERF